MKYRICKNRYGWWKVQCLEVDYIYKSHFYKNVELVIDCVAFLLFPLTIFVIAICLMFDSDLLWNEDKNFCKKRTYTWRDTFSQELYKTKEEAEKAISKLLQEEEELEQQKNNDWECQGEY